MGVLPFPRINPVTKAWILKGSPVNAQRWWRQGQGGWYRAWHPHLLVFVETIKKQQQQPKTIPWRTEGGELRSSWMEMTGLGHRLCVKAEDQRELMMSDFLPERPVVYWQMWGSWDGSSCWASSWWICFWKLNSDLIRVSKSPPSSRSPLGSPIKANFTLWLYLSECLTGEGQSCVRVSHL